jgi:hypothetical protein
LREDLNITFSKRSTYVGSEDALKDGLAFEDPQATGGWAGAEKHMDNHVFGLNFQS